MHYTFGTIGVGVYYKNNTNSAVYPYYKILGRAYKTNGVELTWSCWSTNSKDWLQPSTMTADAGDGFGDLDEISWLDLPMDVNCCPFDGPVIKEEPNPFLVWRNNGRTRCLVSVTQMDPGDERFKY